MRRPHIYPCNCYGLLGPDTFRSMCSIRDSIVLMPIADDTDVRRTVCVCAHAHRTQRIKAINLLFHFGSCAVTLMSPTAILFVNTQITLNQKTHDFIHNRDAILWNRVYVCVCGVCAANHTRYKWQDKDAKLRDENAKRLLRVERKNQIECKSVQFDFSEMHGLGHDRWCFGVSCISLRVIVRTHQRWA